MNTEVFELSEEETQAVAGTGTIDPSTTNSVSGELYPEILNEPPP